MNDAFPNDLELDALSDEELEQTVRNLCHAVFLPMKGGSVLANINGKGITPRCAAEGLRAIADFIEQKGIPKGINLSP